MYDSNKVPPPLTCRHTSKDNSVALTKVYRPKCNKNNNNNNNNNNNYYYYNYYYCLNLYSASKSYKDGLVHLTLNKYKFERLSQKICKIKCELLTLPTATIIDIITLSCIS